LPGLIISAIRIVLSREELSAFRPKIKALSASLVFCIFFLPGLASCQSREVLDLEAPEAARLLSEGDIYFILRARPSRLGELLSLHPGAAFYAGLLAEAGQAESAGNGAAQAESPMEDGRRPFAGKLAIAAATRDRMAASLYEVSLKSPSAPVREAALQKLIPLHLKTGDDAAVRRLIRQHDANTDSSWGKIIQLTADLPRTGENAASRNLAAFFLSAETDEAYRWGWTAVDRQFFSETEAAAINGRLAAARSSFAEALASFEPVLEQEETLFFRYPALLNDLGRAFQFAAAGDEGAVLFQEWEGRLRNGDMQDAAPEVGYLLPYFAGRMERQQGHYPKAVEAFTRALAAAPDAVQEDACMWYILNVTQSDRPEALIPILKTYIPRWHSIPYFDDILERQARYFTTNRQWDALLEVYSLFPKESGWAARGQYAYILGRAASLGLLGNNATSVNPADRAADFFKTTREEEAASFYYRALAGHFINAAPLAFPEKQADGGEAGPEMEFLLGFFQYGAAGFVDPYLQSTREDLTVNELRTLAVAFQSVERWDEAIRLISFAMGREGYELTREDLEIAYPRPFRELTEIYAREAEIPAALLYGLMRTESAFNPDIHSRVGAAGLTQLMTPTALDMAGRLGRRGGPQYVKNGEIDLQDPETNIHLGAVYLRYLMDNLKDPMAAILAYNGGMGRVRRWKAAESALPEDLFLETIEISETRDYGRRVFGAAAVYGYLYYGISMEATVADIIE
jgi:soluble lytic murein transglycosylase